MKDTPEFWKRKLMAFLHDPPSKPLDFSPRHENDAWSFAVSAGMDGDDRETFKAIKDADHMASAADRLSFPPGECANTFNGKENHAFKHPLSGSEYTCEVPTTELAVELLHDAVKGIDTGDGPGKWKHTFFLYWRRWLSEVVAIDKESAVARHMAYYPAETRLPDHSIWVHMSLASALQGCRDGETKTISPAFLSFNIGPVQEFIAQARSTRDLWSGSYLLSWLAARAMKVVADHNGPDAIIFPSLRGQGVFDAFYREEIYSKIFFKNAEGGKDSLWERMYIPKRKGERKILADRLLNPTLPNRFLAVLNEDKAEDIAKEAEKAVKEELRLIADACWEKFAEIAGRDISQWRGRWDRQIDLFPSISWQVMPWIGNVDKALEAMRELPANKKWDGKEKLSPAENLARVVELSKKSGYRVDNPGHVWAANFALAEHAMAARRNTRDFLQFDTDKHQAGSPKDSLNGKDEIIGDKDIWGKISSGEFFRDNEGPYGAVNILKRLWCHSKWDENHLFKSLDIRAGDFRRAVRFESVPEVVKHNRDESKYVAVIAMDGDEMGKWISGEKTPSLLEVVGEKANEFLKKHGIGEDVRRQVSPSFHLQFSEALANFATHVAGKIVEHYEGQLVYAGGDDVLAMLPADNAVKCARALRACFRGKREELPEEESKYELAIKHDGFVAVGGEFEYMVPGPRADVSCGIAIAHEKHPLQAVVKEARRAEKRAKSEYGRAAFAISILKHGGETLHWGTKWEGAGVELLEEYVSCRENWNKEKKPGPTSVSNRFPYALAELLAPYALVSHEKGSQPFEQGFDPIETIKTELEHVFERQGGSTLRDLCHRYLANLAEGYSSARGGTLVKFDDFAKLFLTSAFLERDRKSEQTQDRRDD